jgi:hypothetical protein
MGERHLLPRPREELYLMEGDPHELENRITDPQLAELRADLAGRLDDHLLRTNDPVSAGVVPVPPVPSRQCRMEPK